MFHLSDVLKTDPLALSYYAAQVLLFRGLMSPATMAAKANPDSYLRKWFHTALAEFESFTTFITSVTLEDLTTFWGRRKLSIQSLTMCANRCRFSLTTHPLRKFSHLPLSACLGPMGH